MWKREVLLYLPYVPMGKVEENQPDWYSEQERDRFLAGIFRKYPTWYLFFYLTCRLGLRRGEVYAVSFSRIRRDPPMLTVNRQVQRGIKGRPAQLTSRKNKKSFTMQLPSDVLDAIDWHVDQGYAGEEFLFSKDESFPTWLDSHQRPMRNVQKTLGLRQIGHHAIGRHSVASQAATEGESLKAIQAQLGHRSPESTNRYMHLGSRAQLHVVETLAPTAPEHAKHRATSQQRVNEDFSGIG
jgi:integrase